MKFAYTILYVKDVLESIAFYEAAFGFTKKFITPEGDYGELVTGDTTISMAKIEFAQTNFNVEFTASSIDNQPFGVELAFTSETIEGDFEKALSAGAILVKAIKEKPWGQKVGYLRDINGFLIEVCTPMEEE